MVLEAIDLFRERNDAEPKVIVMHEDDAINITATSALNSPVRQAINPRTLTIVGVPVVLFRDAIIFPASKESLERERVRRGGC